MTNAYNSPNEDQLYPVYCIRCKTRTVRTDLAQGLCPLCTTTAQAAPSLAHSSSASGRSSHSKSRAIYLLATLSVLCSILWIETKFKDQLIPSTKNVPDNHNALNVDPKLEQHGRGIDSKGIAPDTQQNDVGYKNPVGQLPQNATSDEVRLHQMQTNADQTGESQFREAVAQAAYQHSVAEQQVISEKQFGTKEITYQAAVGLAKSLDYDIAAIENRLSAGNLTQERSSIFSAELTRIRTEQKRQLSTASLDVSAYDVGLAGYNAAISKNQAGIMTETARQESASAKEIFRKINAHSDEAISAVRSFETRLQTLADQGGH